MAERFLFGQVDGFLQLAAVERILLFGDLKHGAVAGALGEDDLCDIEEWIYACDLMDFLDDELDCGLLRDEGEGDTFRWSDLFAVEIRATTVSLVEIAASAASTLSAALSAAAVIASIIAVAAASTSGVVPAVAATARLVFALCGALKFLFNRLGFCTCPSRAEGEL